MGSTDKIDETISQQVIDIANTLGCKFTLKGEEISAERVFAVSGLLPAIMRRADQLCSFCLGYGLGLTYEKFATGMLGVKVEMDEKTPISLRLLFAADVIIELMQTSPTADVTPVDELMLD